jgi:hypothetical protein
LSVLNHSFDERFSTSCDQQKKISLSGMLGECDSSRGLAVCLPFLWCT